ncbi:MAG: isocitrate lyase/phosphoenolpyruvate mutase family protein [Pseudomonadota bacterium]
MTASDQHARALRFAELHRGDDILVLPNAWDAGSARVIASVGFPAMATASAGVSWAYGMRDGEGLQRADAVTAVRQIAGAVELPVTADIERGYGDTPDDVAETIKQIVAAGAVGINIEDGVGRTQREIPDMQARIAAAREAAGDLLLWINARVDGYLLGRTDDALYDDTVARAAAWISAGADSIFVPGPADRELIARLVSDIAAPLNVIVVDDSTLAPAELQWLGVKRISLGPRLIQAAFSALEDAARSVREEGSFRFLSSARGFADLNRMMRKPEN